MSNNLTSPATGDMYRCTKCELEVHVTKGCTCEEGCARLECCGESMKKVTEPSVVKP